MKYRHTIAAAVVGAAVVLPGCQALTKKPTAEYMQTQSELRLCRYYAIHAGKWLPPAKAELEARGIDPRECYARVTGAETVQAERDVRELEAYRAMQPTEIRIVK